MPALVLGALLGGSGFASQASVPNTFTPGTVADANQVNTNFRMLRDAINDTGASFVAPMRWLPGRRPGRRTWPCASVVPRTMW